MKLKSERGRKCYKSFCFIHVCYRSMQPQVAVWWYTYQRALCCECRSLRPSQLYKATYCGPTVSLPRYLLLQLSFTISISVRSWFLMCVASTHTALVKMVEWKVNCLLLYPTSISMAPAFPILCLFPYSDLLGPAFLYPLSFLFCPFY